MKGNLRIRNAYTKNISCLYQFIISSYRVGEKRLSCLINKKGKEEKKVQKYKKKSKKRKDKITEGHLLRRE